MATRVAARNFCKLVAMLVLMLITFVNVLGFGLIIPLLPFYVERVGAGPEIITLVISLHAFLQFITAPAIGRLSDHWGRRPVLAWTMVGATLSHALLAYADSLWMVILARGLGGIMAGGVGVAYAYVTDVTSGAKRAKGMGYLGAAFGMGFMVGPGFGGILAGGELANANFVLPAMSAAGLAMIAWLGVVLFLPESRKRAAAPVAEHVPKIGLITQLKLTFTKTTVTELSVLALLIYIAWSALLAVFALWTNRVLAVGPRDIGLIFMYSGFIGVVCQVTLIGPMTRVIGEKPVVMLSVVALAVGLVMISTATTVTMTLMAMTLMSASHSVFTPVTTSLISKEAEEDSRGVVLGVFQGIGSLGRVIGPAFSGVAYAQLGVNSPYWIGAALMVPCVLLSLHTMRRTAAVGAR